jgi:hypothetical protein
VCEIKQINLSNFSVDLSIIFVNCDSIVYPLDVRKENNTAISFIQSNSPVLGCLMAYRQGGAGQQGDIC